MNAEDIRKISNPKLGAEMEFACAMLQEIAVQLAELNAKFQQGSHGLPVFLCSSNDDIPVRIKS